MENQRPVYTKRKKTLIDFSTLSPRELESLSTIWEREAFIVEVRLENEKIDKENSKRLHEIANKLWRRLQILESWRIKNVKKQRKTT